MLDKVGNYKSDDGIPSEQIMMNRTETIIKKLGFRKT